MRIWFCAVISEKNYFNSDDDIPFIKIQITSSFSCILQQYEPEINDRNEMIHFNG